MKMSFQQTDKFTIGSLVTRLTNDITACQDFVGMALRMMVRTLMQFIGGIVMVLSINATFGYILLFTLPIQIIIIVLVLKKGAPLFSVVQGKLDRVNSVVQENVSGARVVKAYTREDYENERFNQANDELVFTNLRVQKLMALLVPTLSILMNASVIMVIWIGGDSVRAAAGEGSGRKHHGCYNLHHTDTHVHDDDRHDVPAGNKSDRFRKSYQGNPRG